MLYISGQAYSCIRKCNIHPVSVLLYSLLIIIFNILSMQYYYVNNKANDCDFVAVFLVPILNDTIPVHERQFLP